LIFQAIEHLRAQGKPFDALTVGEQLKKAGKLDEAGGYDYLHEIIESVPHAAHAKYYADQVRDRAMRRRAIYAAGDTIRDAHDLTRDVDDLLAAAETKLHSIIETKVSGEAADAATVGLEYLASLDQPQHAGIPTGFGTLDSIIGGFKPGQLIIVAARTSVGKTAFAGSMALQVAKAGTGVLFASLEQLRRELMERFVCAETGFATQYLQRRKIDDADKDEIVRTVNDLTQLPFTIFDGLPRTIAQIAAQARLQRRRSRLGLVIVDYLQLVTPDDRRANREAQVAEISRGLKALALSLEVPVVALAQLNRSVEMRDEKRPRLSDLRESGAIEQDADMVIFLNRPALYDANADKAAATAIVAKHRNGQPGEVSLLWEGARMRFVSGSNSFF
jgi:replicative DNA helicase